MSPYALQPTVCLHFVAAAANKTYVSAVLERPTKHFCHPWVAFTTAAPPMLPPAAYTQVLNRLTTELLDVFSPV